MKEAVDWGLAARRAGGLTKAGPPVDAVGLRALVASLRSAAGDSPAFVADVTGLTEAAEIASGDSVLVVDRPRWSESAAATFRAMAGDALPAPNLPGAARVAGEQLGFLLALLSTRVLGQFDPYAPALTPGSAPGRLVLVAPNILNVQRQLDAHPADFHLWVCLHEQTHAVQFAAAPWLADYLRGALTSILRAQLSDDADDDDETAAPELNLVQRILSAATGNGAVPGLLEAVIPASQRDQFEHVLATMALVEGHADVVMDAVGPRAIPSVRQIRAGFEQRRDAPSPFGAVLRRLLGLDAKLAQYREGAAFVRGVLGEVGHHGLNRVWEAPENLPTPREIQDPATWVGRVARSD